MEKGAEDPEPGELSVRASSTAPAVADRTLSSLMGQMTSARWPALGPVLSGARERKGWSRRKAAKALGRRLKERFAQKSNRQDLRRWEEENAAIPSWLLTEYLHALEAPIEEWVRVLMEFGEASGETGYGALVSDVCCRVKAASKKKQREMFPVLREWVEMHGLLVGLMWRIHLLGGAIEEMVVSTESAGAAVLPRGGMGDLMQRFEKLDEHVRGLLERTRSG